MSLSLVTCPRALWSMAGFTFSKWLSVSTVSWAWGRNERPACPAVREQRAV